MKLSLQAQPALVLHELERYHLRSELRSVTVPASRPAVSGSLHRGNQQGSISVLPVYTSAAVNSFSSAMSQAAPRGTAETREPQSYRSQRINIEAVTSIYEAVFSATYGWDRLHLNESA